MTDDNFYQKQATPWKTFLPSMVQYSSLINGIGCIVRQASEKSSVSTAEYAFVIALGTGGYILGKIWENSLRQNALANSFTHLEETILKELKSK